MSPPVRLRRRGRGRNGDRNPPRYLGNRGLLERAVLSGLTGLRENEKDYQKNFFSLKTLCWSIGLICNSFWVETLSACCRYTFW